MPDRTLPVELMAIVIHHLGVKGLRTLGTGGFLVCKDWCYLAEEVFYEKILISPSALLKMPDSAVKRVQQHTKWLGIEAEVTGDKIADSHNEVDGSTIPGLAHCLNQLSTLLAGCKKLKFLSIRLGGKMLPCDMCDNLLAWSQPKFINAIVTSSLQRLEIDTLGSRINPGKGFCRTLSTLIPKLRYVSLKLQWVCLELFGWVGMPVQDIRKVKLRQFILSLVGTGNGLGAGVNSCICGTEPIRCGCGGTHTMICNHVSQSIEVKAIMAVLRMPTIKHMWIVYPWMCQMVRAHEVREDFYRQYESSRVRASGFDITHYRWEQHDLFADKDGFLTSGGNYYDDDEAPEDCDDVILYHDPIPAIANSFESPDYFSDGDIPESGTSWYRDLEEFEKP
ncbi:hypothetical protein N7466_002744 [Penicillium verhagenii]|uniref:uncharacterized protein n=1 Tax=Penicillium verhagenii TaxID=1562060 RepID=UPI002544F4D3|nr:uncharacterized protein N7466_002744 [Penicillium verhagenii]KAJ5939610.1 hypothetical protein N7466_002744 [Penicillium verhagenii]